MMESIGIGEAGDAPGSAPLFQGAVIAVGKSIPFYYLTLA